MKKLIQLLEANIKLNSSGCSYISVDSDIGLDLVNDALLKDICTASKNANVNVNITSAVSDHSETTDSGAVSRHSTGSAVDISKVNGVAVKDPSNKRNVDSFVIQLEQLGYKRNSEGGNTKSVLWQMADHYNHVHVSNKEQIAPAADGSTTTTTTIPPGGDADSTASDIMNSQIGAAFGTALGLKEHRVNKEIGKIRNLLK
jgi:hypothetical protein